MSGISTIQPVIYVVSHSIEICNSELNGKYPSVYSICFKSSYQRQEQLLSVSRFLHMFRLGTISFPLGFISYSGLPKGPFMEFEVHVYFSSLLLHFITPAADNIVPGPMKNGSKCDL